MSRGAKVLALGGCGGLGRYAVRTLLGGNGIEHVVIADRDGGSAEELAKECGPRASSLQVDVTDEPALRRAIASADMVMSAVGPYFRFGVPILRAVLEEGRPYADVCDDWEPTLQMLALDDLAKRQGVTAIIGMGITPGVSNLLASLALAELDEPEEVFTGWDLESAMPETVGAEPSAATVHGVEQLSGRIRVWRDGRETDERPLRKVRLDYPGLGVRTAYTIGHPEPVTLPRTFPAIHDCLNVMTARRSSIIGIKMLAGLVNMRLVSRHRAARWAERTGGPGGRTPSPDELLERHISGGGMPLPPLFALVRGKRDGAPASVGAMLLSGPAGGIGGLTGVPLAVGVRMLAEGRISQPGVLPPEAALAPGPFLDALAPLCDPPRQRASDLVLLTRSWESTTLREALEAALV